MQDPLVSIVCITYNHEPFIRQAIDGFLMQKTTFPVEIILAEDCSTDGTRIVCEEYSRAYQDRINYIWSDSNVGAIENERRAIMAAKGKYVALCEGDDFWTDPHKLQRQVDFLEANQDYSVCFHRYKRYFERENRYEDDNASTIFHGGLESGVELTTDLYLKVWVSQYLTAVFRKDAYDADWANYYPNYRDFHMFYLLLQMGKGYLFSFYGGVYRITASGIYSMLDDFNTQKKDIDVLFELYKRTTDERLRICLANYLRSFISSFCNAHQYSVVVLQYIFLQLILTCDVVLFVRNICRYLFPGSMLGKLERKVLTALRRIYKKVYQTHYNHITIPDSNVSSYIEELLLSPSPVMIGRFGTGEFENVAYAYVMQKPYFQRVWLFIQGWICQYKKNNKYEEYLLKELTNNAGFFPFDKTLSIKFSKLMCSASLQLDLLGVMPWNQEDLLQEFYSPRLEFANFDQFEPYDFAIPWSRALRGKKVLVIHPFSATIQSQYARRKLIWKDESVLPDFELKTLKAVQTIAGEKSDFSTWFDALEWMEHEIENIDFDIAIIGCGAYGFPLAAHCKRLGKKAIHLGGATQILFGIKGKRWEELPEVAKFMNEYWVRPLPEETPQAINSVEGGCYW